MLEESGRKGGDAGAGFGGVGGDGGAGREDGAGDVGAEHGGVGGDEEAVVALVVVHWVEGDRVDGDEELMGAGGGGGAVGEFEG